MERRDRDKSVVDGLKVTVGGAVPRNLAATDPVGREWLSRGFRRLQLRWNA